MRTDSHKPVSLSTTRWAVRNARGTESIKTADSMEKYQASLEAGLEQLRQEAGRRREERRGRRVWCVGALNEQAALPCSRDKDVAHSLPDGRGRKEGRGGCRENMFLWLGKEACCKGRGALGPGESDSVSHALPPPWLQSRLRALTCLCYWLISVV